MRMQFKSAATMLVLCLVFQAQADTLTGRAMQRPRPRPERRSWACGGMQNQHHLGSSGAKDGIRKIERIAARGEGAGAGLLIG